ncbi:pyridoxamine 5'-phosphate oxidase [Aeromicrobium sp. Leaf350]|uniref:pyridoxamine 5'-phosphate oxidase n=1 Tax=Aeromicrobium sp. Leaf350 TaxID=2876565 RepID=UPI001E2E688D|nr:pyridoxamine 5'-phosphate oxidase [Aeromicrobium sp. Leaf350]
MVTPELSAMRREYGETGLDEQAAGTDPYVLFDRWLADAVSAGITEPNAMALATATTDAVPSVRIVLLKSLDAAGAVFHTSYASRKGTEIAANPRAAAVVLWHDLSRQVRLEGPVAPISAEESDAYFESRPPGGRISAAASPQSQVVADRAELERRWDAVAASPSAGTRPDTWGGLRLRVESFEFWQGRPNRLHDRIRFVAEGDAWRRERLAP